MWFRGRFSGVVIGVWGGVVVVVVWWGVVPGEPWSKIKLVKARCHSMGWFGEVIRYYCTTLWG